MSLADLLPAIRALPRGEKLELVRLLNDEVTAPPAAQADGPFTDEELRKMFPPGFVAEVWFPGPNPEGVAAAMQALKDFEAKSGE